VKSLGTFVLTFLFWLFGGCAPGGSEFTQLEPVKTAGVMTLHDFVSADTSLLRRAPSNAREILVLGEDSVSMALSLYEFPDIFWLDMYVQNRASDPYMISPEHVILMGSDMVAFKRLEPHEAANIFRNKVSTIPLYPPKNVYDVGNATTGYLDWAGFSRAQAYKVPRALQDPYSALGYNVGAAMARRANRKLIDLAGVIYSTGFVAGACVPPSTAGFGGLFWLRPKDYLGSVHLKIAYTGYEVEFRIPKH
jgi:hypothetical protein